MYTQHRIYIDRVDSKVNPEFKDNVAMWYQKYSQSEFVEIVPSDDPDNTLGLEPVLVESKREPQYDPRYPKYPIGGLCILTGLPSGKLQPAAFVEGSRAELVQARDAIAAKFIKSKPEIVDQWDQWLAIAPQDDDVQRYVAEHGMFVPFSNELFGGKENVDLTQYIPAVIRGNREMKRAVANPSVQWRGNKKHDMKPLRMLGDKVNTTENPDEKTCESLHNIRVDNEYIIENIDTCTDTEGVSYEYIVVKESDSTAKSIPKKFFDYIGRHFKDTEDNIDFKISDVCIEINGGVIYFMYYNFDKFGNRKPRGKFQYEYTPCDEIMSSTVFDFCEDIDTTAVREISDYEKLRKANIQRNQQFFASLAGTDKIPYVKLEVLRASSKPTKNQFLLLRDILLDCEQAVMMDS